jgi:hypothetical protein
MVLKTCAWWKRAMSVLKRTDYTKELFHVDFGSPLKTKSPGVDLIGRSPKNVRRKMTNIVRWVLAGKNRNDNNQFSVSHCRKAACRIAERHSLRFKSHSERFSAFWTAFSMTKSQINRNGIRQSRRECNMVKKSFLKGFSAKNAVETAFTTAEPLYFICSDVTTSWRTFMESSTL